MFTFRYGKISCKALDSKSLPNFALSDRRWFQILYNIARKGVEEQWPHIFHKYNQLEQDWIQIYCAKMQERSNLLEGRCELITLSRDLPSGWKSFPRGSCLGKVLLSHLRDSIGMVYSVWPPPPPYFHMQLDVISLKNRNILKSLELRGGLVAVDCIWKQVGNNLRGWNVHTDKLEYNLVITIPSGFSWLKYSVRSYLNLTIYQCTFANILMLVDKIFVIDRINKKITECLSPANFNRLRLEEDTFLTNPPTSPHTISLLWCQIPREGGIIKKQVIATYSLTQSDPCSATTIRNFIFDFQENWDIHQVEHHSGCDLVKAFHTTDKIIRWFLFDCQGNQIFSANDKISLAMWVHGKLYAIKEFSDQCSLHHLDFETQLLDKGLPLEHLVIWMLGLETTLLLLLRTPTALQMCAFNIQTEEWTMREFPCQMSQGVKIQFIENVLSVIPDEGPSLVFHFSGKPNPSHWQLELVESSPCKVAEVTHASNFNWKSRKTPKMNPSLPLIRQFAEHFSRQYKTALACLLLATIILQIKRSDGLDSFFYQR